MKKLPISVVAVAALALAALLLHSPAEARTWTQAATGKTLEGDFVKVEGDKVIIKNTAGASIPVPIAMLSKDDQTFIAEQAKGATEPAGEKPAATAEAGGPMEIELHKMHLCCSSCENGVKSAARSVEGVSVDVDKKESFATIKAPNKAAAQAAIDAIAAAGYWGESDSHEADFKAKGAGGPNVKSMTVSNVHLCCKGCVEAVDKALQKVEGFEEHTAKNKAESFEVKGDFSPAEVVRYLRQAGFNGTFGTE
ncbi:MAG: hypothetical protein KDM91_21555 [Verrucomicrobiae bacterium]|nr:hypothetical protein [Verrucomicrobiae bacterium]MCP5539160.1 hypothetical protein [Akkermansiaceae bacterium]MCP5549811.1 hypothetical protein [Akkermansiaceae bacterium]